MPNLEWDVAHTITSPAGSLDLNVVLGGTTGPYYTYLIQPDDYRIVPTMRLTQDNISQQDGSVLHPRFVSGLAATMRVLYAVCPTGELPSYEPACGADLRLMHEGLMVHLQALLRPSTDPNSNQRLIWTPTGLGQNRMLTAIQTLAWAEPSRDGTETFVEFSFDSTFPYAIDASEDDTMLTDGGGPTLIPNAGTAPFYPVYQVAGTTAAFTITNEDTGDTIVYSGTTVTNPDYAEIVTFQGTVFLNGNSTDLIASINPTSTDFFPIAPGGTNVSIVGADCTVKSNSAYC